MRILLFSLLFLFAAKSVAFENMAWASSSNTNQGLIENMRQSGLFSNPRIREAMLAVDRANFCGNQSPYQDSPQRIGYGATISAPHMHAMMLELLAEQLKPGCKVLDVGSGSGYLSAIFGEMVKDGGSVIGIDHIQELVELGVANIRKGNADLLDNGVVKIVVGNGWEGYIEDNNAMFDAIHVGAAAESIPAALLNQLKRGGRMVIPVGRQGGMQVLKSVDKDSNGSIKEEIVSGVAFVPLTRTPEEQLNSRR